ncbi:hypothetical protein LINPERPRIM_LOCUS15046 [Linum perenne]
MVQAKFGLPNTARDIHNCSAACNSPSSTSAPRTKMA